MVTRPVTAEELKQILNCCNGFKYTDKEGKSKTFRRNDQLKLAIQLQAHIGLRISDVVELKVNSFKHGEIEIKEQKTGKIQNRPIPTEIILLVKEYAIEHGLKKNDKLINISVRAIQKQLKIIVDYLNLYHVSTHSLRKYYATTQYKINGNNIVIVQDLLNHSDSSITAEYIQLRKEEVDNASKNFPVILG